MNGKTDDIGHIEVNQRPVWFIFNGMGSQWPGMGREMMKVETFRQTVFSLAETLKPYGLDLVRVLNNEGDSSTLNSFVGIATVQIALVNCLRRLGVSPDGIVGHSVGELGCSYADECFTAAETLLAAYHRGKCVEEAQLKLGAMAAIGLTWAECIRRCPIGVVPACHNAKETVTISGEKQKVIDFVAQMKSEGVFAKLVDSSDVAFHSPQMRQIAPALKSALDKIIINPKPRSSKWISTSIPEVDWDSSLAKLSSSEYHVNNLCSPVLFQEALEHIPSDALIIEIGPHSLLSAVLKRSLSPSVSIFSLMKKDVDVIEHFYSQLGKLFIHGLSLDPLKLVVNPRDESEIYPLPGTTKFISPMVAWDHSAKWNTPKYTDYLMSQSRDFSEFTVNLTNEPQLAGHCIDGRVLYPATGYLFLVWQTLAKSHGLEKCPVEFQDVEIHRATILTEAQVKFRVTIAPLTGKFELSENETLVVSGRVKIGENSIDSKDEEVFTSLPEHQMMNKSQIYKSLRLRGYEYSGEFRPIVRSDLSGTAAELEWKGDWIPFLDGLLQMNVLSEMRGLLLPTRIREICIDPKEIDGQSLISARFDPFTNVTKSRGVLIRGLHASNAQRRSNSQTVILEKLKFVPYDQVDNDDDFMEDVNVAVDLVIRRISGENKPSELRNDEDSELGKLLFKVAALDSPKETYLYEAQKELLAEWPRANQIDISRGLNRRLKFFTDIVLENIEQKSNLKIIEICYSPSESFAPEIIRSSKCHPKLVNIEYQLACLHPDEDFVAEANSSLPFAISTEWDAAQKVPKNFDNFDLLIVNVDLSYLNDANEMLRSVCESALSSKAFLVLHERQNINLRTLQQNVLKRKFKEGNTSWNELLDAHDLLPIGIHKSKYSMTRLLRRRVQPKPKVSSNNV